jgi:hypothetical protein
VRLKRWIASQESTIAARWYQELMAASPGPRDDGTTLLRSVVTHLVSFIPPCLGEQRERGLEVWQQATHLYGSLAVRRGLAAGEVVEELQLLRNVVLRLFLVDAPPGLAPEATVEFIPPLELLALNRVLDVGVVRASIAYVDDLFFAHLQGSGVPGEITQELAEEMEHQLQGFRKDLEL